MLRSLPTCSLGDSAIRSRRLLSTIECIAIVSTYAVFSMGCRERERLQISQDQYAVTKPDYVGMQACKPCHQEIYQRYTATGMGRSIATLNLTRLSALLADIQAVHDPKKDFYYEPVMHSGRFAIREYRLKNGRVTYRQDRPATYQIGSGNHTISFIENRNGYLYELPLTWYSKRKQWDLSPGYREHNARFDRPISSTCLNCHASRIRVTPQTENHYQSDPEKISCESCHGPGSEHVKTAKLKEASAQVIREAIINPKQLNRERQMNICQQCHLEGLSIWNDEVTPADVEVGNSLSLYKSVFVTSASLRSEGQFKIASQADRLMLSKCFKKSGTMMCTTCHDPHRASTSERRTSFDAKCVSCHGDSHHQVVCSMLAARSAKFENCVSCHMKIGETSDIPHVLMTDHYIRRRIDASLEHRFTRPQEGLHLLPVIEPDDSKERMRNRGIGYFVYYQTIEPVAQFLDSSIAILSYTTSRLGLRQDAEDAYTLGLAYYIKGRYSEAQQTLEQSILRNPQHARAYYLLGRANMALNKQEEALKLFTRSTQIQPQLLENYLGLAEVNLSLNHPRESLDACSRLINLDSISFSEVYFLRGDAQRKLSMVAEAQESYRRTLSLNPDMNVAALNLGATYVLQEKWKEAVSHFDDILRRDSSYLPAMLNKLLCLDKTGDDRAARELARRILRIEPANSLAKSVLISK